MGRLGASHWSDVAARRILRREWSPIDSDDTMKPARLEDFVSGDGFAPLRVALDDVLHELSSEPIKTSSAWQ